MDVLHLDFETSSQVSIKNVGTYRYCADKSTEVICVAYALNENPVQVSDRLPNEIRRHIRDGGLVYAHNSAMEEQILYHVYGIQKVNMRCTSAVASYHALPASLEAVAEYLGLDARKDTEGAKVLRKHFKTHPDEIPRSDLSIIKDYCKCDVEVERAIHRRLGDLPANELKIWQLDQRMNSRGWRIDKDLARRCIEIVDKANLKLEEDLQRLTSGAVEKPTQAKRIIDWLASAGVITDNLTKDTVVELLDQNLSDTVRQVLLCRQRGGGSSTGKYAKALAMAGEDSHVRGNLKYHGATTGRWSGSGLQVQNLPRGNVSDTDALAEMFLQGREDMIEDVAGNVYDGAKSAVRPMLTASSPDSLLLVADYSSIECRVLAWLAGQDDLLDEIRSGVDTYCSFAERVFKKRVTKAHKKERSVGKVAILGLGYGMGAAKFQSTLKTMAGLEVSLSFAKSVVDTYRSTYGKIRDYWYELERGAIEGEKLGESKDGRWYREGNILHHILSSGRIIRYQNIQSAVGGKYDREGLKYQRPLGKNMVWSDTYGGKLCENICQATARCVMSESMLQLDQEGIDLIATVHDEIIAEAPADVAEKTLAKMESVMSSAKSWSSGLPLATEGFVNYRFKK
tara:strand:- start:2211 stop:4085 length:1875 start_codon:yes stop_codon:yes gene_type:complete